MQRIVGPWVRFMISGQAALRDKPTNHGSRLTAVFEAAFDARRALAPTYDQSGIPPDQQWEAPGMYLWFILVGSFENGSFRAAWA